MKSQKATDQSTGLWFASDPSKRWTEIFFLAWSVVWILTFGTVVATKVYETFGDFEYMALGLFVALPHAIIPLLFPAEADKNIPLLDRYWVKANIWIGIFGFVGNYLWTHYFYKVLHATYAFPITIELNRVPLCLYFVTHAYFSFYHTVTTIALRRFWTSATMKSVSPLVWWILSIVVVFLMSYFTAFMEAFTIASVPYYVIRDRTLMYVIGSAFYGIYFYVSFPMYYRIQERKGDQWNISRCVIDALAATMLVTLLLDFWRLIIGGLFDDAHTDSPPWL